MNKKMYFNESFSAQYRGYFSNNLISPADIIENLEAGLESFREIMVKLNAK